MNSTDKQVDPIPEAFESYEEAAEFWDRHDTIDYLEFMKPVAVEAELRQRHIELEIDEDVVKALHQRAKKMGIPTGRLASNLLRQQIAVL